jgi:hypothetical protein
MPAVESRAIRAVDYDAVSRTLFVVFTSGARYAYSDVPQEVFHGFLRAESKGTYFAERVRDAFPTQRMQG